MRTALKLTALAITISFAFTSCKKESGTAPPPSFTPSGSSLSSNIQQGKWKITFYSENGNNETNHYTGYDFQFTTNGIVTATKLNSVVTGTWGESGDSNNKLILNFGTLTSFEELNDDWHIITQSSTLIKLTDESGGKGGTDFLTFERN